MFSQTSVCSRDGGTGGEGVGSQMCHGIGHMVRNLPPSRYSTPSEIPPATDIWW